MQTILVVEDEPQIAALVRDYLEHAGFAVLTATDGRAGVTLARADGPTRSSSTLACRSSMGSTSSARSGATRPSRSWSSPRAGTRPSA